jgi:hypothetical protein
VSSALCLWTSCVRLFCLSAYGEPTCLTSLCAEVVIIKYPQASQK